MGSNIISRKIYVDADPEKKKNVLETYWQSHKMLKKCLFLPVSFHRYGRGELRQSCTILSTRNENLENLQN